MARLTKAGWVSEANRTPEEADRRVASLNRRKRPMVAFTLSEEAITRLELIAKERGLTKSGAIEQLIRNARIG